MNRIKQTKVENLFFILATIFIFSFMFVFPINRVPDEMNHARMTWEVLHKPTLQSFNWMDEISSDAHVNPSDYEKVLNQKLDMNPIKSL